MGLRLSFYPSEVVVLIRRAFLTPVLLAAGMAQACNAPVETKADTPSQSEVVATGEASTQAPAPQEAHPIAAPPARSDGLDWALRLPSPSSSSQTGVLAFELANTDHQPLFFSCQGGSGRMSGGGEGLVDGAGLISLESGDQSRNMSVTADTEGPGPYFSFDEFIASDDPLILALSDHGWIWLTLNGQREGMPASPSGQQAIAEFLAFCG